jgi:hypothetical protein
MAIDPDHIRVDLLKVKRKIYISYPEGSDERKQFMLAAKMSELSYLQHLVTPDMVDMVFEEYLKVLKAELINFLIAFCLGCSLSITLFAFHRLYPDNMWLDFWYSPIVIGFGMAGQHVYHAVLNWRRLQPFKKEYNTLQSRIKKLLGEIKGLAK